MICFELSTITQLFAKRAQLLKSIFFIDLSAETESSVEAFSIQADICPRSYSKSASTAN